MAQLTGAQIIIECLLRENVDVVFGYPGGAILPTYDALYEYRVSAFIMCWCGTSKVQATWQTAMHGHPAR